MSRLKRLMVYVLCYWHRQISKTYDHRLLPVQFIYLAIICRWWIHVICYSLLPFNMGILRISLWYAVHVTHIRGCCFSLDRYTAKAKTQAASVVAASRAIALTTPIRLHWINDISVPFLVFQLTWKANCWTNRSRKWWRRLQRQRLTPTDRPWSHFMLYYTF